MTERNFNEEIEIKETTFDENSTQNFFNSDFLLLLFILYIFFTNTEVFSSHFQFLNDNVKQIKSYLDAADATLQALDQASQIPKQMLK